MIVGEDIMVLMQHHLNNSGYSNYTDIDLAFKEVCRLTDFHFLKAENTGLLKFDADTSEYTLDMSSMRALIAIYRKGGSDSRWMQMYESPIDLFEERDAKNTSTDGVDVPNFPVYYTIEEGSPARIRVTPTPDVSYDARVNYIRKTPTITKEEPINFVEEYIDIIAELAAGRRLMMMESENDIRRGSLLVNKVMRGFDQLVHDVERSRSKRIERPKQKWLR